MVEANIWQYRTNKSQLRIMKKLVLILSYSKMLLVLLVCSCVSGKAVPEFNTEIICPSFSYRFLILHATKQEVEQSIENAIIELAKTNEDNKYTVLYFPNQSTTSIYNTTPTQIKQECFLEQRLRND